MKTIAVLLMFILLSCSATKTYYYQDRHYRDIKLVLEKDKNFEIINSYRKKELGFEIHGRWHRLSDSEIQLDVDTTRINLQMLPASNVIQMTDEFNWETYRKYGNSYIFPFRSTYIVYERDNGKSIQVDILKFINKRSKVYMSN